MFDGMLSGMFGRISIASMFDRMFDRVFDRIFGRMFDAMLVDGTPDVLHRALAELCGLASIDLPRSTRTDTLAAARRFQAWASELDA